MKIALPSSPIPSSINNMLNPCEKLAEKSALQLLPEHLGKSLYSMLTLLIIFISACNSKEAKNETQQAIDSTQTTRKQESIAPNASTDTSAETLIIPGRSIGDIALNTDATSIFQKNGKPDAGDAAMGKATAEWKLAPDTAKYSIAIYTVRDMGNDTTALIKRIRVTAPQYKTKDGFGTSSLLRDLRSTFKLEKQKGYRRGQARIDVYADLSGVAFEIDEQQRCIGIVVYEKGKLHPDTYFGFLYGISALD